MARRKKGKVLSLRPTPEEKEEFWSMRARRVFQAHYKTPKKPS